MRLRAATTRDAEALAEIHEAARRQDESPWSAAAMAALLDSPGAFAEIAEDAAGGFALARAIAGEAEILTIAVRPEARRQGLGRALMRAVAIRALAAGAERMTLETAADNAAALALYEGMGFARVGRRRAYYRRVGAPAMDAVILAAALTDGE